MAQPRNQSQATREGTVLVYQGDLFRFCNREWTCLDNPIGNSLRVPGMSRKRRRYRGDDGSAPSDYQSGCVIVAPTMELWRWNIEQHRWENI